MSGGPGRRGQAGHVPTSDQPADDVLVVPPIPLATGRLLEPEDDGPPVPITSVEIVVSTDDGGQLRIPLVHRHGAWWAP